MASSTDSHELHICQRQSRVTKTQVVLKLLVDDVAYIYVRAFTLLQRSVCIHLDVLVSLVFAPFRIKLRSDDVV